MLRYRAVARSAGPAGDFGPRRPCRHRRIGHGTGGRARTGGRWRQTGRRYPVGVGGGGGGPVLTDDLSPGPVQLHKEGQTGLCQRQGTGDEDGRLATFADAEVPLAEGLIHRQVDEAEGGGRCQPRLGTRQFLGMLTADGNFGTEGLTGTRENDQIAKTHGLRQAGNPHTQGQKDLNPRFSIHTFPFLADSPRSRSIGGSGCLYHTTNL